MTEVQDTASLDEKTVQRVARGEVQPPRKPRKARKATRKATPVRAIKVDPRVWKVALLVAGGDRSRLVIRSATAVTVKNPR